jgi:hypothetical protein
MENSFIRFIEGFVTREIRLACFSMTLYDAAVFDWYQRQCQVTLGWPSMIPA